MLAKVRSPLSALIVAAACLLESGCLFTVFVKDAAGDESGTGGVSGSSGPSDQMSGETDVDATTTSTELSDGLATTLLPIFDLGGAGDEWEFCSLLLEPCDADDDAIDHALGVNCTRGLQTDGDVTWSGSPTSRMVLAGSLGTTTTYAPTEGTKRVLMSTGDASHVTLSLPKLPELGNCPKTQTCPSTDAPGNDLQALPPPIDPEPQHCPEGEPLPGSGDCSETVKAQWSVGGDPLIAFDYTELRFSAQAPSGTVGFRFDFAFLTAEHPARFPGNFNDMFVAWVASERFTGNIALDPDGHPIGAVTLPYDIKFDPTPIDCQDECPDIPLHDFAFEGHAGTAWYEGEVEIRSGEAIEVVFALFDVGDPTVDSAVLLDGVQWLCAPPPSSV